MKFPVITFDDALFLEPADRGVDIFFRISEINYLFRVELPIPRVFGYEIVNVGSFEKNYLAIETQPKSEWAQFENKILVMTGHEPAL